MVQVLDPRLQVVRPDALELRLPLPERRRRRRGLRRHDGRRTVGGVGARSRRQSQLASRKEVRVRVWGGGGIYSGENYDKEASLIRDNGLVV